MSRNIPIKVERKEHTPSFYAESIQLAHSITGFKLTLFKDRPEYEVDSNIGPQALMPRTIVKEILAEINFSPQQMKILVDIVHEQLSAYESRFGEVNLPSKPSKKDNTSGSYI